MKDQKIRTPTLRDSQRTDRRAGSFPKLGRVWKVIAGSPAIGTYTVFAV